MVETFPNYTRGRGSFYVRDWKAGGGRTTVPGATRPAKGVPLSEEFCRTLGHLLLSLSRGQGDACGRYRRDLSGELCLLDFFGETR